MEKEHNEELRLALDNLHNVKSKFSKKIHELKALRHSTEDALKHDNVTEGHIGKLQAQLEHLTVLRQKYEDQVEAFNVNFASEHLYDATHVEKLFDESQIAYLNTTVNIGKLIRSIHSRLDGDVELKIGDFFKQKQEEPNDKDEDLNDHVEVEGLDSEEEGDKKDNEKLEAKGEKPANYCKTIALYILIVIVVYFVLGLIISLVLSSRSKNDSGTKTNLIY